MAYCHEQGLPHSVFLGCECGLWHEEDRAKTMAYALEKADRCAMCGTSQWEWEHDPDAYVAVRHFCPGCHRKELISSDPSEPTLQGTSVVLLPRRIAERLAASLPKLGPRRREKR